MQLRYLLVVVAVSDVSDVKVTSSTVNIIGTKPCFFQTKPNSFPTESEFFHKPNQNAKKIILHIPKTRELKNTAAI